MSTFKTFMASFNSLGEPMAKKLEYEAKGYRKATIKEMSFDDTFTYSEEDALRKYKREVFLYNSITIIFCIIFLLGVFPIILSSYSEGNKGAVIFTLILIGAIYAAILVPIFIQIFGKKTVAEGTVVTHFSHRIRARKRYRTRYYVVVAQDLPEKIYVDRVPIRKSSYLNIQDGDKVVIIKTAVSHMAFPAS